MLKVLVITYYWPPSGGAGVQRWLKFVKYMQVSGLTPVVYTAENGEMPVIDNSLEKEIPENTRVIKQPIWEPYNVYKTLIGRKKEDKINAAFLNEGRKIGKAEQISVWIRGNFFIPDARKFWIRPSIRFLTNLLQTEHFDAIISTGPPHSMHLIALGLKKKFPQLYWLADFRDPWTQIDFYDKLMLTNWADKKHHRLERKVLLGADKILSVGKGMDQQLKAIYQNAGGKELTKFHVIPNGFDDSDLPIAPVSKDFKFSIAHIGTFVKDRNADDLWRVLAELVKSSSEFKERLEIKLVGKVDQAVKASIQQFGLQDFTRYIDYLPHNEVISEQMKSHVLLLPVNRTPNAQGILTGKFFEYMATGVPILAIGPTQGDLAAIIKETGCGLICDFNDELAIKNAVWSIFNGVSLPRNNLAISKYSRKGQTIQLAEILNELVNSKGPSNNR